MHRIRPRSGSSTERQKARKPDSPPTHSSSLFSLSQSASSRCARSTFEPHPKTLDAPQARQSSSRLAGCFVSTLSGYASSSQSSAPVLSLGALALRREVQLAVLRSDLNFNWPECFRRLRHDASDHCPVDIRQSEISPCISIGQALVIESQQVQQRGV